MTIKDKRILIFGDSNTWGYCPTNATTGRSDRFDDTERWPGVLEKTLGDGHIVLTDGLNGRTTVWEDPLEEYRCGKEQIIPSISIHAPLDLLIIMVGTNDMKSRFNASAEEIAQGAGVLVTRALSLPNKFVHEPTILLVSPPGLGNIDNGPFRNTFAGAQQKIKYLSRYYRYWAKLLNVAFFDAATSIKADSEDGLHLNQAEHDKLGQDIAPVVKKLLYP